MIGWTVDYENEKLPSRLRKGNEVYTLQRSSGAFPYILNYSRWDPCMDCSIVAIQSYGSTEEKAVDMMLSKLRELGLNV